MSSQMSSHLNLRSYLASAASFGGRFGIAKVAGLVAFAALVAGALVALPQASVEQASASIAKPEMSSVAPNMASVPATCTTRSWPYVDQRCVSNAQAGNVRTVRLVNTDGIADKTITTPRPAILATASITHVAANSGAVMSGILRSDFVAPGKAAPAKATAPAPQKQAATKAAPRKVQVAKRDVNIHYGRDVMAARTVSVRQDDMPGLAYAAGPLNLRPF
jgi:hypothetical protein